MNDFNHIIYNDNVYLLLLSLFIIGLSQSGEPFVLKLFIIII